MITHVQVRLRGCRSERNGQHCFLAESRARIALARSFERGDCSWDLDPGYAGLSGGEVALEAPRTLSQHAQFPLV